MYMNCPSISITVVEMISSWSYMLISWSCRAHPCPSNHASWAKIRVCSCSLQLCTTLIVMFILVISLVMSCLLALALLFFPCKSGQHQTKKRSRWRVRSYVWMGLKCRATPLRRSNAPDHCNSCCICVRSSSSPFLLELLRCNVLVPLHYHTITKFLSCNVVHLPTMLSEPKRKDTTIVTSFNDEILVNNVTLHKRWGKASLTKKTHLTYPSLEIGALHSRLCSQRTSPVL